MIEVIKYLLMMDQTLNLVLDTKALLCGLNLFYKSITIIGFILFIYYYKLCVLDSYILLSFIVSLITLKERYSYKINKLDCSSN